MVAPQNTDLQRVWKLVQELSIQLKANKIETEKLKRAVDLNQRPQSTNEQAPQISTVNSVLSTHESSENGTANHEEMYSYSALFDDHATLKYENEELLQLVAEYEVGMARTMEQVRNHEEEVTLSTLALHSNYASQLNEEREKNAKLVDQAATMQAQIQHLSSLVRDALNEHSDIESEIIIEALRLENEALRTALGDSRTEI